MQWVADRLVRWRWAILALWAAGTLALAFGVAPADPRANEPPGLLPPELPSQRAVRALGATFPRSAGLSQAAVVFERPDDPATPQVEALTEADYQAIRAVAGRIDRPDASPFGRKARADELHVLSPANGDNALAESFLREVLVSPAVKGRGQCALVTVQIPANYITMRASDAVNHITHLVAETPTPAGLNVAVTGSAGFGHDYAVAAQQSHRRTLWVTVVAVVAILLAVYRAPLAALAPLTAISVAAVVARCVLAAATHLGMHVGAGEEIFVYVLLYGAGVDYSLFLIARYREYLLAGHAPGAALSAGWRATAGAILASASTTIAGMLMLSLAQYRVFRTVGPAVAVALIIALAASLTLLPAMVAVLGRRLFWLSADAVRPRRHRVWLWVAKRVTGRPLVTAGLVLAVMAPMAVTGGRCRWVYDTLADLSPQFPSVRGAQIACRHWPVGELSPIVMMIRLPAPATATADGSAPTFAAEVALARQLTGELLKVPGVTKVRSIDNPLGVTVAGAGDWRARLRDAAVRTSSRELYSHDGAMLLNVVTDYEPFSNDAMAALQGVQRTVDATLRARALSAAQAHYAGPTAEMLDLRTITQRDFRRVAVAALAVIAGIVLLLLRDVALSLLLVASTVLGYLATLGLTCWVFSGLWGVGVDWKVQVFLFVVMVAVGQDYNIYLSTRLAQEARRHGVRQAARRAIVATGGIISSCGLIMAATLGSLLAGDITLLKQLGLAFAAGMLIDTFVIRPLLVPALAVLTGRTGKSRLGAAAPPVGDE